MTNHDEGRLIDTVGTNEQIYAHIQPVVQAELSWGNRLPSKWGVTDKLLNDRSLTLMYPFHMLVMPYEREAVLAASLPFPPGAPIRLKGGETAARAVGLGTVTRQGPPMASGGSS